MWLSDPLADLNPKENVNRIARNMIECAVVSEIALVQAYNTLYLQAHSNATLAEVSRLSSNSVRC